MDYVSTGRLLLIEDDAVIAAMYRLKLENLGWQVEVAYDGESGLSSALAEAPALILLDIGLPKLDGLGVLRALRASEATRDVPVLVVSNSVGLPRRELEARKLGIEDWLVKAKTTPAGLAERVRAVLNRAPAVGLQGPELT